MKSRICEGLFLRLLSVVLLLSGAVAAVVAQDKQPVSVHLDWGVSVGSDGLALDLAAPIGDYVQLRAGFAYMPRFQKKMSFQVQMGDDSSPERFEKIADMMKSLTGYEVDDQIDMIAEPNFWNGKLLVDVFPFKKKNWYFTAGLYLGPKCVARAYNTTEDMPSLMGLSMYNNIYDKVLNEEPIFDYNGSGIELPPAFNEKILGYGRMSVPVGTFAHDVTDADGNVLYHQGDEYRMVPNEEGMVKAQVLANVVRPYVGFGYRTPISKDQRTFFSFDAGVLCWGNLKMMTHDGVDVVHDLENVQGQMAKYVRLVSGFKVYPVLNITISRRLL